MRARRGHRRAWCNGNAVQGDKPGRIGYAFPRSIPPMQLILISGMSGSGKSVALNVLEDAGYYCVDNLPASLLPATTEFLSGQGYSQIAVSVDVRSGSGLAELPHSVAQLKQGG